MEKNIKLVVQKLNRRPSYLHIMPEPEMSGCKLRRL